MYREKIDEWIDSKTDEMLEDLKTLVRIDSTRGEALEGKPFGEGPAKVLEAASSIMEGYGLTVTNYDNRVVTGDFDGPDHDRKKVLDILAHLDVVPVTDEWTVTAPFEPLIKDGRIYGRGTADDKGPAVAALYAIRAVRELGIPLSGGVRLILGSDEECGSSDLEYYFEREEEAEYSFTPDADYPLINLEKARLALSFTANLPVPAKDEAAVVSLKAGDKVNVVPAKAYMTLRGIPADLIRKTADEVFAGTGYVCEITPLEEGTAVLVKGMAAHASTPQLGLNAISGALELISALPLSDGPASRTLCALGKLFPVGDTSGKALGVEMADETSGALTMNLGILKLEEGILYGEFDSRAPVMATDENLTEKMREALSSAGITMEEGKLNPAHYVPADSVLVKALLDSYERYFGKKGEPLAIGGGTYVHGLKRGVAFGCMIPEVDNHMHGDDEFMEIEMLTRSAKIFADAIVRLCG